MNKRYDVIGLGILLCLNIVLLLLLINSDSIHNKPVNQSHKFVLYDLTGTGQKWDVEGYKVIITDTKVQRGSARLRYKDEPREIDQSNYINVVIIEDQEEVFQSVKTSTNGPVSILTETSDSGSIESSISEYNQRPERSNVENTQIKISWTDSKGKLHQETVDLHINYEYSG